MNKLITLLITLMLALSLAACGDTEAPVDTSDPAASQQEPSSTPDDSTPSGGGTKIEDINTSNWVEVIEDNYGLALSLPSGWTVSDTYGAPSVGRIDIEFAIGGDGTFKAFGEEIFAALKEIAAGDITHYTNTSLIYNSFDEADGGYGTADMIAVVDAKNNKTVTIHYLKSKDTVTLKILRKGF